MNHNNKLLILLSITKLLTSLAEVLLLLLSEQVISEHVTNVHSLDLFYAYVIITFFWVAIESCLYVLCNYKRLSTLGK